MAEFEDFDAIVIGAGTRGLVATYVLSTLGYRAALVDRAPDVGSGDGSFKAPDGTWFDYGMHVLDEMRSPLATRLFGRVCAGVHRTRLRRAIVLRDFIVPYASEPRALPPPLRRLLPGDDLIDDIGDRLPRSRSMQRAKASLACRAAGAVLRGSVTSGPARGPSFAVCSSCRVRIRQPTELRSAASGSIAPRARSTTRYWSATRRIRSIASIFPGRFAAARTRSCRSSFRSPSRKSVLSTPTIGAIHGSTACVRSVSSRPRTALKSTTSRRARCISTATALIPSGSNIFPVVPSMANLNLNAHIPLDVGYVTSVLTREI